MLYPLTSSSIKAQRSLQELQPKLEEIKKKYADDKQQQTAAIMEMYKTHRVNPVTSCLPMLIQFPILIALYLVLRDGLGSANIAQNLYPLVANPGTINSVSLGWIDMGKPNAVLAVLAGIAQFWQAKSLIRKAPPPEAGKGGRDEGMAAMMNKQMLYVFPVLTVVIGFSLQAGLTWYWFLSTVLMALQQMILQRQVPMAPATAIAAGGVVEGEIVKK